MSSRVYSYTPKVKIHSGQQRIESSKARFRIIKAGRRFGKTKYGIRWLISIAVTKPGELVYYVAPTYRMAKEIAWRELLDQLPNEFIVRKDERELWVDLINGCRICLKVSDDPDHLRGRRLAALLMDEAAFQKGEVYSRVLRPMLADLQAPAMFISSPKPGWFSHLYKAALECKDGSMAAFHFTIYDNPTIPRSEIDEIRRTTPEHIWRSEYMAMDVEYSGQVYMEFSERNIFSHEAVDCKNWPTVLSIDWGSDDPTGISWLNFDPSGCVWVTKEHLRAGWDTGRHSEIIRNFSLGRKIDQSNHVLSFDAFSHRAKDHNSIAEDFRDHLGFMPQASVKDFSSSVDIMKRYLRGDGESPWLRISSECPESISAFQSWEWNDHEPDIIASIRYGLIHGIKRGLSKLAEFKKVKFDYADNSAGDGKTVFLPKRPKSRVGQWGFDNDFGVPNLGMGYA